MHGKSDFFHPDGLTEFSVMVFHIKVWFREE